MALVLEDGSRSEAGANSYVSVADAKTYALVRGLTFPVDDAEVERLLIKGMDYLEGIRLQYRGSKVDIAQPLQWPRLDVDIDGFEFPSTSIPKELKLAQCQLAVEINKTDPNPTISGPTIKRERVDVVETEYAISNDARSTPRLPKVDALLAPLLKSLGLTLIRV